MSDLKNKHLTLEQRIEIQECLNRGMTFKAIGKHLGKDPTTISKEVKKHIAHRELPMQRYDRNGKDILPVVCPTHMKASFVCNPCKRKTHRCSCQKQFYVGKIAQKQYEQLLVEAREGVPLNKESFYEIDRVLTENVKKGQHLFHIIETNKLDISKSTVYRHAQKGYYSFNRLDLPRAVKFKPRKVKPQEYVPKRLRVGRTYTDFLQHIDEFNIASWVEMDTVIGRIGGKTIMTLHFNFCNFMVGLLLEGNNSDQVTKQISYLKSTLTDMGLSFGKIFPLILTDNGGEFSNVFAIENDISNQQESFLFFCDPHQSSQKAHIEKNHTLFRDIVPKGSSFDHFNQDTVNLIFSHVNSVKRNLFNGKSPYELFSFTYGEQLALTLGISYIDPANVVQSPLLLKL